MRTITMLLVIISLPVCGLAAAQEGAPGDPTATDGQSVTQSDLANLASKDDLAAMMAQWQAANDAANAAKRQRRSVAPRLRQRANALALQISSLKVRVEKLERINVGGPAAPYAESSVQYTLDSGLLVGRQEGATVDDDEWQQAPKRQELAVALVRLESRNAAHAAQAAQVAVATHNEDQGAHPFLQNLIGEECRQRKQSDTWLWVAVIIAAIIGLIGWFLPRIRAAVAPIPAPEQPEELENQPVDEGDGADGPVPAPEPGAGDPPAPTPDEGGDDDQ
jgi:hypothetical protein